MLTRFSFTFLCLLLLFVVATNGQTFYGTTNVTEFRKGRDAEFRNKEESPLKSEDFDSFKGLNYFPVKKAYRVNATFKRTADEKYSYTSSRVIWAKSDPPSPRMSLYRSAPGSSAVKKVKRVRSF